MQSLISFARLSALGAVFSIVPFSLNAQSSDDDWNHFGLNFRAGFNIKAKFSEPSSGGGGALPPGPDSGSALNHQYNDGFVNVDSSHNQGGQTWNWGYKNPSQVVEGEEGSDIFFHGTAGTGGSESKTDDPNLGFDFNYVRDLTHASWGQFGIKIAFGYTHVQINDGDPINGSAEAFTDEYALNDVVPPQVSPGHPYVGSYSGPGPVLGSEPISRTTSMLAGGGMITGNHNIDAAVYDLRLGPAVNIPIFKRFSVQASAGAVLGIVDSDFSFLERSGGATTSGDNTRTSLLPGGYGEIGFAYRLCHAASIYTGAQYEYLGDFRQSAEGRTARLDFGATIFYELGLEWHF